ncbi:MAG: M28 family peptidase [Phycisphaeraceae bacterium]|nr:M28 family peptidase [Phycisphaeraceae bacterium]
MRRDVGAIAGEIGDRNAFRPDALAAAERYLAGRLADDGYAVERQAFVVHGIEVANLIAELPGTARRAPTMIVGAHYDSHRGCPAANDNASGCAAVLALARVFAGKPREQTIRFVLFTNEEQPFFWTRDMGSLVYARSLRERGESVSSMLCIETIGCYSDERGSQRYPPPFNLLYPSEGNFIAFVGNRASRSLVRRCVESFRSHTAFPAEGAALSMIVPRVGSSDHWAFWKQGYPAVMVTDTAPYRYRHYHKPSDTPEKLDYDRMARVTAGLERVIAELASDTTV